MDLELDLTTSQVAQFNFHESASLFVSTNCQRYIKFSLLFHILYPVLCLGLILVVTASKIDITRDMPTYAWYIVTLSVISGKFLHTSLFQNFFLVSCVS